MDDSSGAESDGQPLRLPPSLSSLNESLFDVASYLDSESLSPTEFYARRSLELHVAADESAVRCSRHTLILAILELCCSLRLETVFRQHPWTAQVPRLQCDASKALKWNTLKTAAYPSIDLVTQA